MNQKTQRSDNQVPEAVRASFFEENLPPLRNFAGKHIISAEQFDRKSLEIVFEEAEIKIQVTLSYQLL